MLKHVRLQEKNFLVKTCWTFFLVDRTSALIVINISNQLLNLTINQSIKAATHRLLLKRGIKARKPTSFSVRQKKKKLLLKLLISVKTEKKYCLTYLTCWQSAAGNLGTPVSPIPCQLDGTCHVPGTCNRFFINRRLCQFQTLPNMNQSFSALKTL